MTNTPLYLYSYRQKWRRWREILMGNRHEHVWPSGLRRCVQVAVLFGGRRFESCGMHQTFLPFSYWKKFQKQSPIFSNLFFLIWKDLDKGYRKQAFLVCPHKFQINFANLQSNFSITWIIYFFIILIFSWILFRFYLRFKMIFFFDLKVKNLTVSSWFDNGTTMSTKLRGNMPRKPVDWLSPRSHSSFTC